MRRAFPRRWSAALIIVLGMMSGPVHAQTAPAPAGERTFASTPDLRSTGTVVDPSAPALPTGLSATSWLVADLDTGKVLAAKDAHGQYAPASTLKSLTTLALLEHLPADTAVVPAEADLFADGSKVYLSTRITYTADQLFHALMMVSANDAGDALFTAVGGRDKALSIVNEYAARLGAADTVAKTSNGLDAPGQVSSAYDLALLARAGMQEPRFVQYVQARSYEFPSAEGGMKTIHNKNKLLSSYEGALGIKNGYTTAARASFVGAAERDGRRLVAVIMRSNPSPWQEAAKLLDWGFAASAAGVGAVGQLVEPAAEPTPTPSATEPPASDTVDRAPESDNSTPWLTLTAGSLVAVTAVGAVTNAHRDLRRKRRRQRRR